ncbi:MAG: SDR family NAD(P)-dependent oxidoreductase [Bryobacteraceae bacterium]|nr:SDR family NAD(P)-dependent oxidoreductase [Bryobacteraceae bacterium]
MRIPANPMAELQGQSFLITGASGGLGPAVTNAFLKAGASVYAVARRWDTAPSAGFVPVSADLTRPAECERAFAEAAAKAGRIRGVVHLMGGFAGGEPVSATSVETWQRMMDMNVNSAFYLFRVAMPHLQEQGGRILAVGSKAGLEPAVGLSAYHVSKAALHALIRTLALEGKAAGVTANAVLPGTIDTAANRAAMPNVDTSQWIRPEAIAALLLWLASDVAADITGSLIPL